MKHNESFHGIHTRLENKGKNTLRMHAHTHTRTQTQVSSSSSSSSMHRGDLAWQLVSEPCCSSGRFEFIRLLSGAETRCRPVSLHRGRLQTVSRSKNQITAERVPPVAFFASFSFFYFFIFILSSAFFMSGVKQRGLYSEAKNWSIAKLTWKF